MTRLPPDLIDQHREALAAGVRVVEMVDSVMHQLEYLRTVHLAALSHLASVIARDEEHRDHGEHVHRAIEAEVAVATRTGQTAVANQMGHAAGLLAQYPAVSAAFARGELSLRHTEVIADAGQVITDPEARAAYESAVLPLARTMSTVQLRPHARRLAERHAERDLEDRHHDARRSREVRVTGLEDGMAQLTAVLGAVEAYAIKDRLSRLAHRRDRGAAAEPGIDNESAENATSGAPTLRQSQADVFVELLLRDDLTGSITDDPAGGALDRIAARVQITVPIFALAGIGGPEVEPHLGAAVLEGYGPIDLATARRLAGRATAWDRVLTHPISGAVLAVDRYRPSEDLRRLLSARDLHCRFPGCTRRLDHCDIDHTLPASRGGPTSPENSVNS